MCGPAALRTLGLTRSASVEELKLAYRALAKKWHPDGHPGPSKAAAEAKFKEVQQAFTFLKRPGALREAAAAHAASGSWSYGARGRGGRGAHPGEARHRHASPEQEWGDERMYGSANRPGYNPYGGGYMGFGKGGAHWYEDTAAAAAAEDRSRMFRTWFGLGIFALGLFAVTYTSQRDRKAKARGDLVDAWYNHSTRRWERPLSHMYKDPLLSSLIDLKPPDMVHAASTKKPKPRKPVRTLDGVKAADAYRAREQGMR